jgi:hypothetical protein
MWVGWETLHHAYGPATDVPQLLRDIASDNAAVRSDAMRKARAAGPRSRPLAGRPEMRGGATRRRLALPDAMSPRIARQDPEWTSSLGWADTSRRP